VLRAAGHTIADLAIDDVAHRMLGDVDGVTTATLRSNGSHGVDAVEARITMAIDGPSEQRFVVHGTSGTLVWPGDEVFTVWRAPCVLEVAQQGRAVESEAFEAIDPYVTMIEQSQRAMAGGEPSVMPAADSIALASVLDALLPASVGERSAEDLPGQQ
jgi:predicted dehydrogenase